MHYIGKAEHYIGKWERIRLRGMRNRMISSPRERAEMQSVSFSNQARLPTYPPPPVSARSLKPARVRVRQWPSHAPQKLQDFEDCDYSAHAAESSVRHGSPACA